MIVEAILLVAIIATGFVVCLDKILYPRHNRLFRGKPKLVVFSQSVLPILAVVLLIRSFTFEAFRIPSSSMKPTLIEGDLIVVDKYSAGLRLPVLGYRITSSKPKRGDIVVFRGEFEGKANGVIKRIVGLPGDRIQYQNRTLYINGVPASQLNMTCDLDLSNGKEEKVIRATEDLGNIKHDIFMSLQNNDGDFAYQDITVPKNSYFVLGDYRSKSLDSRNWGVLSDRQLVGKARFVLFSFSWKDKDIRWKRIGKIS